MEYLQMQTLIQKIEAVLYDRCERNCTSTFCMKVNISPKINKF